MSVQRNYKMDARFYEEAWKACAEARNREEQRMKRQIRWLAGQLERVSIAMMPPGFIHRNGPTDADSWIELSYKATEEKRDG